MAIMFLLKKWTFQRDYENAVEWTNVSKCQWKKQLPRNTLDLYIYMCVCVCVCVYINIISMYSCRKNDGIANKNDLFMEKSLKMTLLKQ